MCLVTDMHAFAYRCFGATLVLLAYTSTEVIKLFTKISFLFVCLKESSFVMTIWLCCCAVACRLAALWNFAALHGDEVHKKQSRKLHILVNNNAGIKRKML